MLLDVEEAPRVDSKGGGQAQGHRVAAPDGEGGVSGSVSKRGLEEAADDGVVWSCPLTRMEEDLQQGDNRGAVGREPRSQAVELGGVVSQWEGHGFGECEGMEAQILWEFKRFKEDSLPR